MAVCLQIHNDYLIPGGETKSAQLIANLLEENGIKVIRYYKHNDVIQNAGIGKKLKLGCKSIYNLDTCEEIQKILDTEDVDFALIHNTSPLISNSIYKVLIKNKIRVFKYMQNYNLVCFNGALDKKESCNKCQHKRTIGLKNKCYKNSFLYSFQKYISLKILWKCYVGKIDGFIAISDFVKQKHVEFGIPQRKIHTIYHFCEEIENTTISTDHSYLIYMGRLSEEKGIMTLIRAIELVPYAKLKIMGKGELEEELKNYVSKNKIENVEFIGYKSGKDKEIEIQNALALVAPSEWEEPFGRIVIEAYQLGIPVIASKMGGLNELVKDGYTGYKFEAGNVFALKECIQRLYELSEEEYFSMRDNCYSEVQTKYSKEAYYKKFCQEILMKKT